MITENQIEQIVWNNIKNNCRAQKCLVKQFFKNEIEETCLVKIE